MTPKLVLALIATIPGSLQKSLMALMTTIPQISAVMVAEEASRALKIIKDHHPTLLISDINLPEVHTLLKQVKTDWPLTRCIILVDRVEQMEGVADIDAMLIKGFSPEQFNRTVEKLLSKRENDSFINRQS